MANKPKSLRTKEHRLLKRKYDHAVKVLMEVTRDWTEYLKEGDSGDGSKNLLAEVMKMNLSWAKNIKKSKTILRKNNIKI